MLFIKLINWSIVILVAVSVARVLINRNGGWTAVKQKVKTWYGIPVIGPVFKFTVKAIRVVTPIVVETLVLMAKMPVIRTFVAVIGKIGRIIKAQWAKLVAWSQSE